MQTEPVSQEHTVEVSKKKLRKTGYRAREWEESILLSVTFCTNPQHVYDFGKCTQLTTGTAVQTQTKT